MALEAAIKELTAGWRGEVIQPGDDGYDEARRVYNAMIDRRPRLIVRCADIADVIVAVNFARENGLLIAVRGGSHNVAGFAVCDDGMVIDLSRLKGIRVNVDNQTVRAEGGCTWGDLDHATHAFGLAVPGGIISSTGIAGLTLGGGIGYLTRKYGLSCDNLISADVVTAAGTLLTASENENSDLFWAIRGGGGNFGIVTSFEFRSHPVSTVFAGPILWPLALATDAMRFYAEYMANAPEDMNAFFAFLIVPPGPPFPEHLHNKTVCGVVCCYSGSLEEAEEVVRPLRDFGPPVFEHVSAMPYPSLQTAFDALLPSGLNHYWKGDFVKELNDPIIERHIRYGPEIPTVSSAVHIYPVNGAAQRVGKQDSAYNHRDAQFVHIIAAVSPDAAVMPKYTEWVREYWSSLHPYSAGGAYVNFLMEEGDDRIKESYRENYDRLVKAKMIYDPTNLFSMNQNIKPPRRSG